jgi:hypothetical protein
MEEGVWLSGGAVGEPKAHDLPAAAETLIARQSAPVAVFPEESAPSAPSAASHDDPWYINMQYYNPELFNNDATVFIARRSLNLLRFRDGMAGLAFSN